MKTYEEYREVIEKRAMQRELRCIDDEYYERIISRELRNYKEVKT